MGWEVGWVVFGGVIIGREKGRDLLGSESCEAHMSCLVFACLSHPKRESAPEEAGKSGGQLAFIVGGQCSYRRDADGMLCLCMYVYNSTCIQVVISNSHTGNRRAITTSEQLISASNHTIQTDQ